MVEIHINKQDFTKYLMDLEIQRDLEDTDYDPVVGVASITLSDIDYSVSTALNIPLPDSPRRMPLNLSVVLTKDGNPLFSGSFDTGNVDTGYYNYDNIEDSRTLILTAYDGAKDAAKTWAAARPYPVTCNYSLDGGAVITKNSNVDSSVPWSSLKSGFERGAYLIDIHDFMQKITRVATGFGYKSPITVPSTFALGGGGAVWFASYLSQSPSKITSPYPYINAAYAQTKFVNWDAWCRNKDYTSSSILDIVNGICSYRDGRILCLPNGELYYAERWSLNPLETFMPTARIDKYTTLGVQTLPVKQYLGYPYVVDPNVDDYGFGTLYYSSGNINQIVTQAIAPIDSTIILNLATGLFGSDPRWLFCNAEKVNGLFRNISWEYGWRSDLACKTAQSSYNADYLARCICNKPPTRFKILTQGYNYFPMQGATLEGTDYMITSTAIRPMIDEADVTLEFRSQSLFYPVDP